MIAVLAHALTAVGLEGVMAVALPENVGSWRVMEKTGMRYEGTASYYGLEGLKKYTAERDWWKPPGRHRTRQNTGHSVSPTTTLAQRRDGAPASFAPWRFPA